MATENPTAKSGPAVVKPKASRKSHIKRRTGCITCKIRRVKCDERKPICERCIKAEVVCDGYRHPESEEKVEKKLLPWLPEKPVVGRGLNRLSGTSQDTRAFDFFCSRTAPMLSGPFDTNFWTHFLLQFSYSDPTVWHAVLALSALHEQYLLDNERESDRNQVLNRPFALHHYNAAVGRLTESLPGKKPSTEVVLVSCMLFVCLELLLENVDGAINHVHGGIKIIHEWKLQNDRKSPSSVQIIEECLNPIFENFNMHSFIYGRAAKVLPFIEKRNESREDGVFDNIHDARSSLLNIMDTGQRFAQAYSGSRLDHPPNSAVEKSRENILARLRRWWKAFCSLLSQPKTDYHLSLEELRGAIVLELQHKTGSIWISNALSTDETSFDAYVDDFDAIVRLATTIFKEDIETPPNARHKSLSFEIQNIAPLYMTAIKCRNPLIRRKALALMRKIPRREGFWDSYLVSRVAERVIEIEEEGLEDLKDSTDSIVPSEWSRVHEVVLAPERVANSRRAFVSFSQRVNGRGSDRSFRHEYIKL